MEEILSVENKTILSGEYAKSDKNKWPSTLVCGTPIFTALSTAGDGLLIAAVSAACHNGVISGLTRARQLAECKIAKH